MPAKVNFCNGLKLAVQKSHENGWSRAALNQERALALRRRVEPGVDEGRMDVLPAEGFCGQVSFFLNREGGGGRGGWR